MRNTNTIIPVVVIVVLAVLLLGGAGMMVFGGFGMMGPGMMGGYGMMGYGGSYGFGYNPIGAILSLVFWALIIGGVALLVIWLVRGAGRTTLSSGESVLDILIARYAKGVISKVQFDAMKEDLQ